MKEIKLFDYQQEMLENITEVFSAAVFDSVLYNEKGKRVNVGSSVMVQMPTGTGKTYVMAAVVRWFLETYSKGEVWLIAHVRNWWSRWNGRSTALLWIMVRRMMN